MSWGYSTDNGPCHWYKSFPAARGFQQSPIDLTMAASSFDSALNLNKLKWGYDGKDAVAVSNTGSSVAVRYDGANSSLTGGPLVGEFQLAQFHFHWGVDDTCGSEHSLEQRCFPAEVHLVHYNTFYGSFAEAVDKPDGLCVLGAFIEHGAEHQGLKELLSLVRQGCSCKGQEVCLDGKSVDPDTLLPGSTNYFTYRGSLTTPPCFESVQWINFLQPIEFSNEQLTVLRNLHFDVKGSAKMVNNYRPICPVLNRKVTRNFWKSEIEFQPM